jgi:tetratricopeptide (TPR) repeat protein
VVDGIDVTYATNIPKAADFFWCVENDQRPWITALDAQGKGLVQTSTSRLRGRKFFVWGMGPGGRRWQEFLSVPGGAHMEIQAGLARTQHECLPMPAMAEWSWLEAYGLMEADPQGVHSTDWARARKTVETRLEEMVPEQWLEDELVRTTAAADRPPEEVLHRGTGWGALERRRRDAAGETPMCCSAVVFDDASLGADQEPWLSLLEKGGLPYRSPDDEPGAWMVQAEWRRMLEDAVRAGRGDHWLSWLHIGVMRYHAKEVELAREAWEKSLALEPSSWAYRNLAVLADHEEEQDKATDLWITACRMAPRVVPLAVECCKALIKSGRQAEVRDLLKLLSPAVTDHPRVRVLTARAALDTGDLETVERILLSGMELSDLREGEDVLTELWFGMQEKRLAAAEGREIDEALRERVKREFPPPPEIDFRMFAVASDEGPKARHAKT